MSAKKTEATTKETEPTEETEVNEAFEAWLEQQGGKEQLVYRMRLEKVTKLISEAGWETTLEELEGKAKEASLLDGFKALTLRQMKGILSPEPKKGAKRGRGKKRAVTKRATGLKRGELGDKILKFIAEHPDCKSGDISAAAGIDPKKITQHLTYIRKNKWVNTKGKLRGMTYRISAEGKKRLGG